MQKTKFIVYLVLTITFVGFSVANGDQQYQKDGFSIALPDGWTEIPKDMVDAHEKAVAKLAPDSPPYHSDYAFQLSDSQYWFKPPYILVSVNHSRRISESALEKFDLQETLEAPSFREKLDKATKGMSPLASDMRLKKGYYDKQTKIIWEYVEANAAGTGAVSGLTAGVLTEKGYIQAICWSLKDDYPTYEPTFVSVAMSITPEPGLLYKPKSPDSLPLAAGGIDWGKVAGKALLGVVVVGMVVWIVRSRKRASQGKKIFIILCLTMFTLFGYQTTWSKAEYPGDAVVEFIAGGVGGSVVWIAIWSLIGYFLGFLGKIVGSATVKTMSRYDKASVGLIIGAILKFLGVGP